MIVSGYWIDFLCLPVNWDDLHFPAKFQIDYVRIWQPEDEENIGCDRELKGEYRRTG